MSSIPIATVLKDTLAALERFPDERTALRILQTARDAIAATQADLVVALETSGHYTDDGASTIKTWLRDRLRLDTHEAQRLLRAGHTHRDLPDIADQARDGLISPGHVAAYRLGLDQLGHHVLTNPHLAPVLAETAQHAEPAQLRAAINTVRDHLAPQAIEEAWIRGMDKQDLKLSKVGDHGWAITGFLPIELGTKLHLVLESLANPTTTACTADNDNAADGPADNGPADDDADSDTSGAPRDERTGAQRRLDGLETLLDSVLEAGLPIDKGIRPHLNVIVDADELTRAAHTHHQPTDTNNAQATSDPHPQDRLTAPAHLVGFGPIGANLLNLLTCGSTITPIVTTANGHTPLDVGRTERCATPRQRRAITTTQGGTCAAPGCTHPIRHIHHITPWAAGGTTDLHNLVGLCPSCHRLTHTGSLTIDPKTHEFTRRGRPPARRNRSNTWHTRRDIHTRLTQSLNTTAAAAAAASRDIPVMTP